MDDDSDADNDAVDADVVHVDDKVPIWRHVIWGAGHRNEMNSRTLEPGIKFRKRSTKFCTWSGTGSSSSHSRTTNNKNENFGKTENST